jgi:hypothetical protein
MSDVTRILSQIESGDPKAAEQLLPLVYDELPEFFCHLLSAACNDATSASSATTRAFSSAQCGQPFSILPSAIVADNITPKGNNHQDQCRIRERLPRNYAVPLSRYAPPGRCDQVLLTERRLQLVE